MSTEKSQGSDLTGEIQQGNTTFALKVVSVLVNENCKITGFFSQGINKEGKRTGFDLVDIETSEKIELCS